MKWSFNSIIGSSSPTFLWKFVNDDGFDGFQNKKWN